MHKFLRWASAILFILNMAIFIPYVLAHEWVGALAHLFGALAMTLVFVGQPRGG